MEPWVSVTDMLSIGDNPDTMIWAYTDVAKAVRCINEGLSVSVADDATAIAALVELGVEPEQAERQVRWAHGQI
jgi:hypothetical protein